MPMASKKGLITLRVEDVKSLEKILLKISTSEHLNDEQKEKVHGHVMLLEVSLETASSKVSLPMQVVLAALQCLAFSFRHSNSIRMWAERLLGDE
jgi:hypothetical protein